MNLNPGTDDFQAKVRPKNFFVNNFGSMQETNGIDQYISG